MSEENTANGFDFGALADAAVRNNNATYRRPTQTPLHDLTIEAARERVSVVDGNRTPKENGSQALTLKFGRYTLSLEKVKPGATRINADEAQVEQFTGVLMDAVEVGTFDTEIVDAQTQSRVTAEEGKVSSEEVADDAIDAGLDLDELDALGSDELDGENVHGE